MTKNEKYFHSLRDSGTVSIISKVGEGIMRTTVLVILVILLPIVVAAQDSLNVSKVGALYDFWGMSFDLAYAGGYVYVPDVTRGIRVVDVTDQENPFQADLWEMEAPFQIQVEGTIAYYLDLLGPSLGTLDITDPMNPVELDTAPISTAGIEVKVEIDGSLAMVVDPDDGLTFYDVSDPANLITLGTYTDHTPWSGIINGNYAYMSHHEVEEIIVLDISNPANPLYHSTVYAPNRVSDMKIQGDYLYCACEWNGFAVYSLADPSSPVHLITYQTLGDCNTLMPQGIYLYICQEDIGLVVFNIESPSAPHWETTCQTSDAIEYFEIQVVGGTAYASGSNPGVTVFDISLPTSPSVLSTIGSAAMLYAIDVYGDHAYLADQTGYLHIADISDPTDPQHVTELGPIGMPSDVEVNDTHAYLVAESAGIFKINVENPSDPYIVNTALTNSYPWDLYERSDTVFVAEISGRLSIIDFTGVQPQLLSQTPLLDALKIHVDGNTAYLIGSEFENNLAIVDVSDPTAPIVLYDAVLPGSFESVTTYGDYLYIANGGNLNYLIVNVTNPASPTLENTIELEGFVASVTVSGDRLFVSSFGGGMVIYDLTDPVNPTVYGYYPGGFVDLDVVGDYAYSAEARTMSIYQVGPVNPDPVTLTLTGVNTTVPAGGGNVTYMASLVSTIGATYPNLLYWTRATLPNGSQTGVLFNQSFNLTPFMNITIGPLAQQVPNYAPPGQYTYTGYVGYYPVPQLEDSFTFIKLPAGMVGPYEFDPADWVHYGDFIAGDIVVETSIPSEFSLNAAYPNPFNATTSLIVELPEPTDLNVVVYNSMGQHVATLANDGYSAGTHTLTFDASNLASGIYFIHATVSGYLDQVQKVMLVR